MTSDAELSAFLDGELEPHRANEIAQLIAADPQLRTQYEGLRAVDDQLRQAAEAAAFEPRVVLPQSSPKVAPWLAVLVPGLPCAWLVAKLLGTMAVSLAINSLSLALLIAGLIVLAASEAGRRRALG